MTDAASGFSRPVAVETLVSGVLRLEVEADEAERAQLARRFDLLRLDRLTAEVKLKPIHRGDLIRVSGRLVAEVVQACGITLEPVTSRIEEPFELTFGHEVEPEPGHEVVLSLDEEDPPDPIENGMIDVGAVVAEQLALAIDPFPRKPGAEFVPPGEVAADVVRTHSPFEALAPFETQGRTVPKEK
ncbi:MAG: DUF177 domain-containing protein [Alphaproteobacteria bacterium]|nr:DUF177 domain-containing protein [Alphaproteobacteria bacterium]